MVNKGATSGKYRKKACTRSCCIRDSGAARLTPRRETASAKASSRSATNREMDAVNQNPRRKLCGKRLYIFRNISRKSEIEERKKVPHCQLTADS